MKKNYVLFFSSIKEANALIFQSKFKFQKTGNCFREETNNITIQIYITGIGWENVNKILNNIIFDDNYFVFKFGTCAVIDKKIEILKPFIPEYIGFNEIIYKLNSEKLLDKIKKDLLINKSLLTVKNPLQSNEQSRLIMKKGFSFVDMEIFFLYERFKNNFFIPIIVGTDRGDENYKNDFLKNLQKASYIFKEIFEKIILYDF